MELQEKNKVQILSELAEANRIMAGIETQAGQQKTGCWMITSSVWGEGKTTLTAGVSMLAARSGEKRVLAVDMNWYSPGLHAYFGLSQGWKLKKNNNYRELIQESGIPCLDVLTAPVIPEDWDASSAVNSELAREILKQIKQAYDLIFVDTASVFPTNRRMTDPVVLASACDGAILIVLMGVTPRQQVKQTVVRLEGSGKPVTGIVVNCWKSRI